MIEHPVEKANFVLGIDFIMSIKRAIVSVTNDLTTDQRVDRTCRTLVKMGYAVLLIGRQRKDSQTLLPREYRMHRMELLFDKGPLFYAEYNFRLFLFLIFHKSAILIANDLDTLLANYLASKLKAVNLALDCHEYFRGVPELVGRKITTRIWKGIEDWIFPKLKKVIAVNDSVAKLYCEEYGVQVSVIRNVPYRKTMTGAKSKTELGIRQEQKVILYQGAVNLDRGLEEAILAMNYIRSDAILVIAGIGDLFEKLKKITREQGLSDRVMFLGQIPFQQLHAFTLMADIGLSVEKDVSLNYHYCLPNKFLDYIQAEVPVLVSPFPEMVAILDHYFIGETIEKHDPEYLAGKLDEMLTNPERLALYKQNLAKAAGELCWENEEKKLLLIFDF